MLKARWLSETRMKSLEDFWMYTMRGQTQDADGVWGLKGKEVRAGGVRGVRRVRGNGMWGRGEVRVCRTPTVSRPPAKESRYARAGGRMGWGVGCGGRMGWGVRARGGQLASIGGRRFF